MQVDFTPFDPYNVNVSTVEQVVFPNLKPTCDLNELEGSTRLWPQPD